MKAKPKETAQSAGLSVDLDDPLVVARLKIVLSKYKGYTAWLNKQILSPHTVRAYKTRLQHFLGFVGERLAEYEDPLTNKNTRDYLARDYKQHLKQKLKHSPQTVNGYLTAIDSFYGFLGLGKAKAKREDLPKLAPQALNEKEQRDFFRAIERCPSTRDRAVATLLIYTGIRISECADLNTDDVLVTERKGLLKVRDGKGGSYREIPLNTPCRESIREWLDERNGKVDEDEEAFFISARGSRLSIDSIDHAVRKLAAEAKLIGLSAHTLRHTCLTNLVRAKNDIVLVAQIGGHKKLETTMRYSLSSLADRESAMEKLPSDL